MIIPGVYPLCPECLQNKHPNCVREALDMETDEIVACQCSECNG